MLTSLLSLLSVAVVISDGLAAHAPLDMRRASHHALAKRASSELDIRQFSGAGTKFTFYYPHTGPGHCGTVHQDDEFIVAMNTAQFENKKHCYKPITLHYKGRSVTAKITDSCPYEYCPYGAVDLSPAAFAALSGLPRDQILNLGVMWGGSWEFGTGGGPSAEEIAAQKAKEKAAREKAEKAARAKAEKEAAEAAAREKAEAERKQKEKEEKARAKAEAEAAAAAAAASSSKAAEAARASASAASVEAAKAAQTTSANASALTPAPAAPVANPQFLSTISDAYAGLGSFLAVVAVSK